MCCTTKATASVDIPIVEFQPRQLPSPQGEPIVPFKLPVRVPVFVPLKRGAV